MTTQVDSSMYMNTPMHIRCIHRGTDSVLAALLVCSSKIFAHSTVILHMDIVYTIITTVVSAARLGGEWLVDFSDDATLSTSANCSEVLKCLVCHMRQRVTPTIVEYSVVGEDADPLTSMKNILS